MGFRNNTSNISDDKTTNWLQTLPSSGINNHPQLETSGHVVTRVLAQSAAPERDLVRHAGPEVGPGSREVAGDQDQVLQQRQRLQQVECLHRVNMHPYIVWHCLLWFSLFVLLVKIFLRAESFETKLMVNLRRYYDEST